MSCTTYCTAFSSVKIKHAIGVLKFPCIFSKISNFRVSRKANATNSKHRLPMEPNDNPKYIRHGVSVETPPTYSLKMFPRFITHKLNL